MSTPIIVSQLGEIRENARRSTDEGGLPRTAEAKPLATVVSLTLALVALAGAAGAPSIDPHGNLATEVVRAAVVVSFAAAGLIALVRRPDERQPLVVLLAAALGGVVSASAALVYVHAHGGTVASGLVPLARFCEPVALALLPVAAMHILFGIPDGSCRLSRLVVAGGYVVGTALGLSLWAQRPSLPLWPVAVEAVVAVAIGAGVSQRRYARSTGLERQRMQWFGWAARHRRGAAAGGAGPARPVGLAHPGAIGPDRLAGALRVRHRPVQHPPPGRPHRPDTGPHRLARRPHLCGGGGVPGGGGRAGQHALSR